MGLHNLPQDLDIDVSIQLYISQIVNKAHTVLCRQRHSPNALNQDIGTL